MLLSLIGTPTNVPLSFGNLNYGTLYYEYDEMFDVLNNSNLSSQSIHVYMSESIVPNHYYWHNSDSLLYSALSNNIIPIIRVDQATFPKSYPIKSRNRFVDWDYFSEYYNWLTLMIDRYKIGGLLTQYSSLDPSDGVKNYSLIQESDLFWAALDVYGNDVTPAQMEIDLLVQHYCNCKSILNSLCDESFIPFGLMGEPYGEWGATQTCIGIDTEAELIEYMDIVFDKFNDIGIEPDGIDWHQFTLWNDPGYPGADLWKPGYYEPYEHRWRSMYFHNRTDLYNQLLTEAGFDGTVCILEGATTPYWNQFSSQEYHNVYHHCIHQLTSNVEVAYGGNTNFVLFDLDIDDITGRVFQDYLNYEYWWDGANGDRADSLLIAISNQATLLMNHYCVARTNIGSSEKPVICYEFKSASNSPSVYQIRVVGSDSSTNSNRNTYSFTEHTGLDDSPTTAVFSPASQHLLRYSMCNSIPSDYYCTTLPFLVSLSYPDNNRYVEWFVEVSSQENFTTEITPSLIFNTNPIRAGEALRIQLSNQSDRDSHQIVVYDLYGRIVYSEDIDSNNTEIQVPAAERAGIYFVVADSSLSGKFTVLN